MKAFELQSLVRNFLDFTLGPIDLDLEPGRVLGYIGPNGSGKSTTMHCMMGLLRPDAGSVHIYGRPNDLNKPAWKLDIGYVGDMNPFYENWSAAKNLTFLKPFYPAWCDVLVNDLIRRFELDITKKIKTLSTGNRIKLAIICALAHQPKLLLLDEPTAGLDPVVRTELLDMLFDVLATGERAIFYSTHILSDISRLADELAFLNHGRIYLRTAVADLEEKWRKIAFHMAGNDVAIEAAVAHRRDGEDCQLISSDGEKSLRQLAELGAQNIREIRMGIDEIAVEIIKKSKSVVPAQNQSDR